MTVLVTVDPLVVVVSVCVVTVVEPDELWLELPEEVWLELELLEPPSKLEDASPIPYDLSLTID